MFFFLFDTVSVCFMNGVMGLGWSSFDFFTCSDWNGCLMSFVLVICRNKFLGHWFLGINLVFQTITMRNLILGLDVELVTFYGLVLPLLYWGFCPFKILISLQNISGGPLRIWWRKVLSAFGISNFICSGVILIFIPVLLLPDFHFRLRVLGVLQLLLGKYWDLFMELRCDNFSIEIEVLEVKKFAECSSTSVGKILRFVHGVKTWQLQP